jgi:glycosyltransferase involved in cell wall biosynthesis
VKEYGLEYEVLFQGTAPYFWTNFIHFAWKFGKAVKAYKADVVCAFGGQTLILSRLAGILPLVLSAQNTSSLHWRMNRPGYILLRFLERWAIGSRDMQVIGCSPSVISAYKQRFGIPENRLHMVYNASDVDAFNRQYHEINRESPRILCVGTLYDQKNFGMALRGLAVLHTRGMKARLQIAGDGTDKPGLERTADELGIRDYVTFLGMRTDIADIMGNSDFLWITSRYEGFGLIAAEAMVARLPIVATRVAGLIDVIDDGVTGCFVSLDDCEALAEATELLIHDSAGRKRLIENAHRTATTRFHPNSMARLYVQIFQKMVQR